MIFQDVQRLSQVIQNLIDNAIKYTDAGFVRVEAKRESQSALIAVSDSGRGMKKELLPRLFEQFSRDEATAKLKQ